MKNLGIIVIVASVAVALPVVDKGVFVITGVKTCRDGYGYCILGTDCTVDKEFVADDQSGHCDGLKKAFTPRAFFVCCQSLENSTIPTTTTTTTTPGPPSIEEDDEKSNESSSSKSKEDESTSKESGEVGLPPHVLQAIGITSGSSSTTTAAPVEEVKTEVSVSESLNVVVEGGSVGVIQKGEVEEETSTQGSSTSATSTTSTTTSTSTTTTVAPSTTARITTTSTTTTTETPVILPKCGQKATLYSLASDLAASGQRIDGSRLAAQQTSLVCWTAAIVRSTNGLQSLQDPGSFICTGALISEDFVLTTATCVSRLFAQDLSLFRVALGSRHLVHPMNGVTADAQYRSISQLIVHEDYNIQGLFKRVNDIALIRLSPPSEAEERKNIPHSYCTVCLPNAEEDHSGEDCIVTGFSHPTGTAASIDEIVAAGGSIEGGSGVQSAHDTDGILHEAEQHIEFANNCEAQLSNFTVAQNSLLRNDLNIEASKLVCASGKFNMEACFSPRDAGSPLACASSSSQYKLVGVFSSGFHCGTTSSPVLYTDVGKFVPWIQSNMQRVNRRV